MPADLRAMIRRWFDEVWNQRRTDTIDELLDEKIVLHGHGPDIVGRAAFKEHHAKFCKAFGEMTLTLDEVIVEGDRVVVMCTVQCRHTGAELGISPTHRHVRFSGVTLARVANGKFVEAWDHYNFLKLYGELGALEAVGAAFRAAQTGL